MTDVMTWGWLRDVRRDELTAKLNAAADFSRNLLYGVSLLDEMIRLEGKYVTVRGYDQKDGTMNILVDSIQESQDPWINKVQIKELNLTEDYNKINHSIFDDHSVSDGIASIESDWKSLSGYRIAYQYAADNLVNSLRDGFLEPDAMIYPIMFLYRHCLELRVKELYIGMKILHHQEDDIDIRTHDFGKLWKEFRSLLSWNNQTILLDSIEKRIMEFYDLDRKSFNFRYPDLLDGGEIMIQSGGNPALLDLHEVREVFSDLDAVLEEIYLLVDDELTERRVRLW